MGPRAVKPVFALMAAFLLLVLGIEALHIVVDWWQAGRPSMGIDVALAIAALAVVGIAWWRHSVFSCKRGGQGQGGQHRPP